MKSADSDVIDLMAPFRLCSMSYQMSTYDIDDIRFESSADITKPGPGPCHAMLRHQTLKSSALRVASNNCDIFVNYLRGIDSNWLDSPEYKNNQEVCSAEDPDDQPEAREVVTMWQKRQKELGSIHLDQVRTGPDRSTYVLQM